MNLAICCVADEKTKYLTQAVRWAQSIRWFGGQYSECDLVIGLTEACNESYQKEFERLNVRMLPVPRASDWHGPSNKLSLLNSNEFANYDVVVMTDCDVIFVDEPSDFFEDGEILAKPADFATLNQQDLQRVFNLFKKTIPDISFETTICQTKTIPYCNSGVVVLKKPVRESFVRLWTNYNQELLDNPEVLGEKRFFTDQASFALALSDYINSYSELPASYNFPSHIKREYYPKELYSIDPVIIHYHDKIDGSSGAIKVCGIPSVDQKIGQYNDRLLRSRRDQFNNTLFWGERYSINPKLGSGLGSRGQFTIYKSKIVSRIVKLFPNSSVVDFGCGDCDILKYLNFSKYTGVDGSIEVVKRNKEKYDGYNFVRSVISGSGVEGDISICFDVLIHQPTYKDYSSVVQEVLSGGRVGGVINGFCENPKVTSEITFYYESILDTLSGFGVHALEVGDYRDTEIVAWAHEKEDLSRIEREFSLTEDDSRREGHTEIESTVFVLGMHRSGTSVVTRALEVLGVELGDRLLPGIEGVNDKGFFEDIDVMNMNINLMDRIGLQWDSLGRADWQVLGHKSLNKFIIKARLLIESRLSQHSVFGIKDPRLCRTLPVWRKALEDINTSSFAVIAVRHPYSVARSLNRRDGFSLTKSYYLWLIHVLEAVRNSDRMIQRVVLDYDSLMNAPGYQIARLSRALGFAVSVDKLKVFEEEFLDSGLKHFAPESGAQALNMPEIVSDTYELLKQAANDELKLDDNTFRERFSLIERRFSDIRPLLEFIHQSDSERGAHSANTGDLSIHEPRQTFTEWFPEWKSQRRLSSGELRCLKDMAEHQRPCPELTVAIRKPDIPSLKSSLESLSLCIPESILCNVIVLGVKRDDFASYDPRLRVHWTDPTKVGEPAVLNKICEKGTFDWLLVVQSGVEFLEPGFKRTIIELSDAAELASVYADGLVREPNGEIGTLFRPDLSLDLLLSKPDAMGCHWFFNRSTVIELGGFQENYKSVFEFAMILRILEQKGLGVVGHASEPMLISSSPNSDREEEKNVIHGHLSERGYWEAELLDSGGGWRVIYGHQGVPLVSIVIPAMSSIARLQRCVESVLEKTIYKSYEIVIVDSGLDSPEARHWLDGVRAMAANNIRVVTVTSSMSETECFDFGVSKSHGDYLVFLTEDSAITHGDWLDNLLNHAQRPEVGIVGSKIVDPEGSIISAGVVLGLHGTGQSPYIGESVSSPGYMGRLHADHNLSAVGPTGWMVSRDIYAGLGALGSEVLDTPAAVIDFCLRARQAGLLNVWTPHVVCLSSPPGDEVVPTDDLDRANEEDMLYQRWLPVIVNDPFYNRNLSLRGTGFEVEVGRERTHAAIETPFDLPRVFAQNADVWGCGHYRIIKPFEALQRDHLLEGQQTISRLSFVEMAKVKPDVVVVQRQISESYIRDMRRLRDYGNIPIIYELDDYLPNLPLKSAYRENMPKDILKSLRKALRHVDRFVVSTAPLAEAFSGTHSDIKVVENCLPLEWWQGLESLRSQGDKPRVGWAGGIGHTGDLELVESVIKELAGDVDWVFFGMCPDKLRPYVNEVHGGVDIELYPTKLAGLNLDLAIAPLEDNLFNRCKSNLRLLEYGACGFPVVCSDVEPYRSHNLPVTRVKNRHKDWVEAIRMHLADLEASKKMGRELWTRVRTDWMLEGDNVRKWLDAWTRF